VAKDDRPQERDRNATGSLYDVCQTIVDWLNTVKPRDPAWSPQVWQIFRQVSRVHGVAPLLLPRLSSLDWVDPASIAWLTEQHRLNRSRLDKMLGELKQILALFWGEGLPVIPLKGGLMATSFYPQAGLRPMADLDLLIRPEDFERCRRLLQRLGYRRSVVHWKHVAFAKPENLVVVSRRGEHPDNPRGVEVHLYCRETFGGPTLDLTEILWSAAAQGELLGERSLLLSPDSLWLHLLTHATYHAWQGSGRLVQLVDLTLLARHLESTEPILASIDARFTYPALHLLRQNFPDAVEAASLSVQRKRVSATFRRWVESLDLVNTSYLNPKPPGLYFLKAVRFSQGRPADLARTFRFALLPRLDELALDHPRLAQTKLPWLAYFLLPVDWFKRLVRKPWPD
jgi:hypothetical protein